MEAKKKRVNGKKKGNGFEGQIAKKLTTALDPLTFIRTPGSGARVGGKNFATFGHMFGEDAMKMFVSDICPTNEKDVGLEFRWAVECKSYKTPDSFTQLVNGAANIFSWFEEAVIDAPKVNKLPMLIFKWNNTPTFVATNRTDGIKPKLNLSYADGAKCLNIYLLDDLLKIQDFWFLKT